MIETVVLIGGPLDGRQYHCPGGETLSLKALGSHSTPLEYRRAHAESKFFQFQQGK